MNFKEYQELCGKTARYPSIGAPHIYPVLGLGGEVGELLNKVKKIHRDKEGVIDEKTRAELMHELGDVLWYVAETATKLGLDLEEVAVKNIQKLASREERGVIKGSGDHR